MNASHFYYDWSQAIIITNINSNYYYMTMDTNKITNFKDKFQKIILKNKTSIICLNPIIFSF